MKPDLQLPGATLRPLTQDDQENVIRLLQNADVRRFLCDDVMVTEKDVAGFLSLSEDLDAQGLGLWAIELEDGRFAGMIGLLPVSGEIEALRKFVGEVEPLVALEPRFSGRGLATAALTRLVLHVRKTLKQTSLVAAVDAPNDASHHLLRRCGFHEVERAPGPVHDLILYRIDLL